MGVHVTKSRLPINSRYRKYQICKLIEYNLKPHLSGGSQGTLHDLKRCNFLGENKQSWGWTWKLKANCFQTSFPLIYLNIWFDGQIYNCYRNAQFYRNGWLNQNVKMQRKTPPFYWCIFYVNTTWPIQLYIFTVLN